MCGIQKRRKRNCILSVELRLSVKFYVSDRIWALPHIPGQDEPWGGRRRLAQPKNYRSHSLNACGAFHLHGSLSLHFSLLHGPRSDPDKERWLLGRVREKSVQYWMIFYGDHTVPLIFLLCHDMVAYKNHVLDREMRS